MSKTLGNVIDPIDTIEEFGTDALRFSISLGTAGQVCFTMCYQRLILIIVQSAGRFPSLSGRQGHCPSE